MARTIFFYDFQRGITQKLRKGEQSFLCGILCLGLIYISMKYREDIWKIVYRQTGGQRHAIIRPFLSKQAYKNLLFNFPLVNAIGSKLDLDFK